MTRAFKVGIQIQPQHTTVARMRAAWRAADSLGVDSIWLWDHFVPISGPAAGPHYEAWSLLGAMCADTAIARIGPLVSCLAYRNPDLTADMARTLWKLSGGRFVLGVGAGWHEPDFAEYGYPFGTPAQRSRAFAANLDRVTKRLRRLSPPATAMGLLVGGSGPTALRLAARYATAWNMIGTPAEFADRSRDLDRWCANAGRAAQRIERTILVPAGVRDVAELVAAGAQHIIVSLPDPFDLTVVEGLLLAADQPDTVHAGP